MWFPMWVFDGNGFTMACLAVKTMRSGAADATAPNGSGQRCRDQRSNIRD